MSETRLYALLLWVDDDPIVGNVLSIASSIVEPRKALEDYRVGETVQAKFKNFPGTHTAVIAKIGTQEEKRQLDQCLKGQQFLDLVQKYGKTKANSKASEKEETSKQHKRKTPVKASSKAKKQKKEPPAPKPVKKCLQMVAKELELTELNQQLELVEEDEIYSPIPSPMCISPDPETPEPARSKLAFPEPATSESTAAPQPLPCTECFSTRQDVKVLQSRLEVANNVISELQSKMHTLQYYVQILWEKDQRQQYAFLGGGNQFYRPYSPVPDTSLRQRPAFHAHCSPASPVATPCTPSPHHSRPTDSVSRQPAQPTIFNSPSPVQLSEKSQQPDLTEVPNDEPEQPLESQPPATPYNPDSQKSQQTDLTEVHVPVPSNEPEQLDSQPPLTPFYNGYTEEILEAKVAKIKDFSKCAKTLLRILYSDAERQGRSVCGSTANSKFPPKPALQHPERLEFIYAIIGKRWPSVSKKEVNGKLAECLKPSALK